MKQESLPPMKEIYYALENAAVDLYGFAVVCHSGVEWTAEPDMLDTLLIGLENFWFTNRDSKPLAHTEFREEFFRVLWEKCKGRKPMVQIGTEVPLGHNEMSFYHLPQLARAALYLRTKKKFSYAQMALVFGVGDGVLQEEVERAREYLLGRRLREMEWSEEDF